MNHKTLKQIARKAEDYMDNPYPFIAVRVQESDYGLKAGDILTHKSNVWDDGEMLDEMIDGVCSIDIIHAYQMDTNYKGSVALILGCDDAESGNDIAEFIMKNPVILEIVNA